MNLPAVWRELTTGERIFVCFALSVVVVVAWPRGNSWRERWDSFVDGVQISGCLLLMPIVGVACYLFVNALYAGRIDRWLDAVISRWAYLARLLYRP